MEEYTILEQVKIRLKQFHIETVDNADGTKSDVVVFDQKEDNPLLEQLIKQVTNEVMNRRMYPSNYTQEQIDEDIKKFESTIVNVVVYDRVKVGGDFQESSSEN